MQIFAKSDSFILMRMIGAKIIVLQFILLLATLSTFGEDSPTNHSHDTSPAPSVETDQHSQTSHNQKRKGRIPREKEAEGTKAPNRFDTDIIYKSQYELNGKSLEVDTD